MLLSDVLTEHYQQEIIETLQNECSDFIEECKDSPLIKELPSDYLDFQKVKARIKKQKKDFDETFNEAFNDEVNKLRQRAVFAHGTESFTLTNEDQNDVFYVFPINGFKFLYSSEVNNSSLEYKEMFENVFESLGSEKANDLLVDVLKFNYVDTNLKEGIEKGSEIIIYNIPYFYALRANCYEYEELINDIIN